MRADDSHALKSIKPEELRQWVEEVFTQGKQQVRLLADSGSKNVDPSLYEWGDQETDAGKAAKLEHEMGDEDSSRGTSATQEPTGTGSV